MITGINHLTLSVKDLDQSFSFYKDILGLKPVARWPKGCYFLAGDLWVALIVDQNVRENALPEYTHFAFTVFPSDFEPMSRRIIQAGCEIFQENKSEGKSLYFIDPNGHKLEIHASDLETRIKTAKENPWDGLEFFD
jgi:catechol 2,3-dioxygenase-like lactoylglutathione lyase family enzyme